MMRARPAEDFAYARDLFDLIGRLRDQGAVLHEAGCGRALFGAARGARLCKASDIGFSLNTLARRFTPPFPGDKLGRTWLSASGTAFSETALTDRG